MINFSSLLLLLTIFLCLSSYPLLYLNKYACVTGNIWSTVPKTLEAQLISYCSHTFMIFTVGRAVHEKPCRMVCEFHLQSNLRLGVEYSILQYMYTSNGMTCVQMNPSAIAVEVMTTWQTNLFTVRCFNIMLWLLKLTYRNFTSAIKLDAEP